ncbi:hypothetical protein ISCGN_002934 [Ixodes scapularis]
MPESEPLVPSWFSGVESMFNSLNVPESIRAVMLLPFLTERMRSVANRIAADAMPSYDDLKGAVLEEFQLAPAEYRELFYKTNPDGDSLGNNRTRGVRDRVGAIETRNLAFRG